MAPFVLFIKERDLTLRHERGNDGFSENEDYSEWLDELDKNNDSIDSFLKEDDIESRLVDDAEEEIKVRDGEGIRGLGSAGAEAIHEIAERQKSKPKAFIDKEKVQAKRNNLTAEEENKILEDKKKSRLRNEKTKVATVNLMTGLFSCVLMAASAIVFGVLYVMHYVGYYLSFITLPNAIREAANKIGSTKGYSAVNSLVKSRTTNRNINNRNCSANYAIGKFFLMFCFKAFCFFLLTEFLGAFFMSYIGLRDPVNYDYAILTIVVTLIIGLMPIEDKCLTAIKKSYNTFQNFVKSRKEKSSNISVGDVTEDEITDKDIIRYFKKEVTSYAMNGDIVDGSTECADDFNDDGQVPSQDANEDK